MRERPFRRIYEVTVWTVCMMLELRRTRGMAGVHADAVGPMDKPINAYSDGADFSGPQTTILAQCESLKRHTQ